MNPETAENRQTIFVADDDVGLVKLIERVLRREGMVTASATTGRGAIEWLSQNSADLLLLDLKMKDLEGSQVIAKLEDLQRRLPFVIITGQGDERVAVEMMKRGAHDYLIKDGNFLDLLPTVVHRTLEHLRQERRLAAAEEKSTKSQALTMAVLNSLPALIAVLDGEGKIVALNEAWKLNRSKKTGPSFTQTELGENYLQACREAAGRQEEGAAQIAFSINAALNADAAEASSEYVCLREAEERWFSTSVTSLAGKEKGVVVVHYDISARKRLEAEILHIAETERQRVAADLHDGICQELTGIGFTAAAMGRELKRTRHGLAKKFKTLETAISEAVLHTRQVARGLNAVVADGHGLMHALGQLAATTEQTQRVRCKFLCPEELSMQNPIVANEIYRIAQEAVSNAVRHGRAKNVNVILRGDEQRVRLTIEDDGKGIEKPAPGHSGMGVRVMQYRAGLIGGSLTIYPRASGGTAVECSIATQRADVAVPD